MWMMLCRDCAWTSGRLMTKEAADILGQLHAIEKSGHTVLIKSAGRTAPSEPEPPIDLWR
jgi:hypothetical protein